MMKPSDVSALLTDAAGVDGRVENGPAAIKGWYDLICGEAWLTPRLAEEARRDHQRNSPLPFTVYDLLSRARAIRRDRLAACPLPDPPPSLLADTAGWQAAVEAAAAVIADGGTRAQAEQAVAAVAAERAALTSGPAA
jgi:hypothetical protein